MKKRKFLAILILLICFVTACTGSNKTYTVTFDTDGGTNVTTVEVFEKQLVSKPANPTKFGYTFLGWYLDNTAFDFSTKITKDIKLVAKWSVDSNVEAETTWNVVFDANGGSPVDKITVKDGETINEKNTKTTKDGYTFLGWYSGDEKFDFTTKITKNITLTAKWEKVKEETNTPDTPQEKKYTVTFNSDGGSKVNSLSVVENGKVSKPKDPTRSGYEFLGWYLGETKFDFNTQITKNITLKAKWKEIVVAPKYGYNWVAVDGSVAGEYYLYLTKDNVRIAGKADLTSQGGKTKTFSIPVTGLKIVKDTITNVSNVREN